MSARLQVGTVSLASALLVLSGCGGRQKGSQTGHGEYRGSRGSGAGPCGHRETVGHAIGRR